MTNGSAGQSTGGNTPRKRRRTTPKPFAKWAKMGLADNASSVSEMPQNEEASSPVMPNLEKFSPADLRAGLSLLYASIGSCSAALVDRYDGAVREVLTKEYNDALKERDLALNKLSILGAELKDVQNDLSKSMAEFELGKNAWEAEKKELTERLDKEFDVFKEELRKVRKSLSESQAELKEASRERDHYRYNFKLGKKVWGPERIAMVNKEKETALESKLRKDVQVAERVEMEESMAMTNKEKENAYCQGYLDGWFMKPHAYVLAWHEAKLADEVTELPVLQMMSKLPKTHL